MEPVENVWRWKRWTATGPEGVISKVFSVLDAKLPGGWRRLTGEDLLRYGSLVSPGSGWYGLEPGPSGPRVALSIERPVPSMIVGGWVPIPGPPAPADANGVASKWDDVGRFLDEGVIPAVRAAGATLQLPAPEEALFSDLPFEVRDRLQAFSDAARKSLPLDPKEAELWRAFVVAVFRIDARFDVEPFVAWMVAAGWPRESAADLYSQLADDCLLLSRYADEVSAA